MDKKEYIFLLGEICQALEDQGYEASWYSPARSASSSTSKPFWTISKTNLHLFRPFV